MMKNKLENGVFYIYPEGRIDSGNAAQFEKDLFSTLDAAPDAIPVLDAENLEYISSAGLRVLMKLRKRLNAPVKIENVSRDVYDILEVTGFSELLDVKKKLREISVDGCEMIGSGGFGRVYRIDPETIVKIYTPGITLDMVQQERDTAQKAFLAGVPTAISYDVIKSGESYGVVYELLNAKTVAQIMDADRSRVTEMGTKSANLLKTLHQIEIKKDALPNRKTEFLNWLPRVECVLEPSEADEIRAFIESLPDRGTFLHGDFNSKNIMVQENGEFILIDIGDAAIGHPVFDLAGLYLPYMFLPKSPMPKEEIKRLLGFHTEDAPTMLEAMCRAYFEINDPAELKRVMNEILPVAQLMATYQGTRRAGYDVESMKRTSLIGIRQRLLPLIHAAQPLDF